MATDEDKMIHKLTVHRNFIGWVINELNDRGIPSKRTTGNDSKGDILLINPKDAPRVKKIIQEIHNKFNS
jgi:hypothetical protein